MKYLTGLKSRRSWFSLAAAQYFRIVEPWRALRVTRPLPIWNDEQRPRAYEIVDRYMGPPEEEGGGGYFGKRFAWKDRRAEEPRFFLKWRRREPWSIGEGFDEVRSFFGNDLAEPLIDFTRRELQILDEEGCPYTLVELYVFRVPPGLRGNFQEGHSHQFSPFVTLFKMEEGPSTRLRPDGMGYWYPPESLASFDSSHALRFTYTWHAGPLPTEDVRFGIVLNARVYTGEDLAKQSVTG